MTGRKLAVLGVLSLIALASFDADAQACKRNRRDRGNDCAAPAPCDPCGGGGHAMAAPYGGVPLAMPVPGGGAIVPAGGFTDGTRIPSTGVIVPAGGLSTESYYFDSRTGNYSLYPAVSAPRAAGRGRIFRR